MLDNEPQGGERDGVTTPSVDAAESTTPARRTRAPRRKATPAAAPAVDAPGVEPGAADEAAGAVDAAVEQAPAAPVRRRRKAAAPAAAPAAVEPVAEDPAVVAESLPTDGEPVAPVKAVRSRRKKAVPPAAPVEPVVEEPAAEEEPVVEEPVVEAVAAEPVVEPVVEPAAPLIGVLPLDDDLVEETPAPRSRSRRAASLPPAVLFMPPEPEAEPAPRRARRGAVAPVAAPADEIIADEPPAEEPVEQEAAEAPRRVTRSRRRRGAAAEEQAEVTDVVEPALEEVDETADDVEDGAEDELDEDGNSRRRRRRGRRGRGRGKGPLDEGDDAEAEAEGDVETSTEGSADAEAETEDEEDAEDGDGVTRRRRRRRRKGAGDNETGGIEDGVHTVVRVREPRTRERSDEVQGVSGSTRLEAKRQRRRDGREQRRTRPPILSESEFLARREAVDRVMVVRQKPDRTQIAVLEDGVLVEHYVSRSTSGTMVGNVYLGKVQNVLPSMEAAFVDVGRGRNAVLYAGEVNWDATGLEGRARSIEQALRSGDSVLVQVTKDPIGHKGARLSSHIALSGRHLVYVPNGNASGISRKLPDNERKRLRDVLKKLVPDGAGVIVRTAAEGASEDELARDVKRLQAQWDDIQARAAEGHAPAALSEEPDLVIRVVRDLFNEDFREVVIQGEQAYGEVESYLESVSPELLDRLHRYVGTADIFADKRIDEQILKGLDRKVFLPSGGHLVIDRTEAMTVVDVNTGKYTGAGGNLEETVTRNNLEAAEEIVRQLRLRDIGGIVVIDFIDMVLENNRELVLRRLTECLGRDRTKHQVTEITSLGLVQMTRKRIGAGLLEAFTETCDHCKGRGLIIHTEPVPEKRVPGAATQVKAVAAAARTEAPVQQPSTKSRRRRGGGEQSSAEVEAEPAVVEAAPAEAASVEAAPVRTAAVEPAVRDRTTEDPAAEVAGLPAGPSAGSGIAAPAAGSGIVARSAPAAAAASDDEYDISGYDLSRYDSGTNGAGYPAEPMRLTGSDDPDAAEDPDEVDEDGDGEGEDDEPVGAGAGARRRSRRGGTRRRTRP
ncbi:ribonuclease E/G [Actinoplanes sp. ATCC 53533]|uniref:Rne/Rng family ribonuclease n=1 Tax=Actinoplanes sp. ATCC 53533 TaxID=1288362 RepID=UPI000F781A58|nr:Rne/Rng family ribonuclease [Actinoplanes sp. ATCC 53533]RSM51087.1 ribonuclease E/G [Actinoplanes sp. ATCC 53533]